MYADVDNFKVLTYPQSVTILQSDYADLITHDFYK